MPPAPPNTATQPRILPDPPPPPPPPAVVGAVPQGKPRNHLRWLIIGVAVVIAGSFISLKLFAKFSTEPVRGMQDISRTLLDVGKEIRVVNPVDRGLTSVTVTKVVRGAPAIPLVGRAEDAAHERVAVAMLVCAGQPFSPNGTVAMHLETQHGSSIFPDPSTATNSLLNTEFSSNRCKRTVLGFTVRVTTHLSRFTYLQFPYLSANWRISAPSGGQRS